MTCPACMGQAVPSLTSPRVYKSPRGAGAHLAGLDKQFFWYLILQKSGLRPVLPRPKNRLGSARQTKMWPNDPATQIVQDEPACAEKRCIFWFDGVLKLTPLDISVFFTIFFRGHGRGIGQDHPGKLKRGPKALIRALYKSYPRELKSDAYFEFSGPPKMNP